MAGRSEISAPISFSVAKVLQASIHDVIAGRALPATSAGTAAKGTSEDLLACQPRLDTRFAEISACGAPFPAAR